MAARTSVIQQEELHEKFCDVICDEYGVVHLQELFLKYLKLSIEQKKSTQDEKKLHKKSLLNRLVEV
jgi:hypothetical protein